ncbi:alpha/beta fold hydrolase [Microbacterium sp. 22195]|uniref:alpha/beta fold hydrolase n=1 Tax=Microbacterium sp. 22195 TaxID=3453891 RepID=UPI003F83B31F
MTPIPAIFVHGWAGSADSWLPILDRLDPQRWTPTALRLPGSRGTPPGTEFTVRAAAELLAEMLADARSPAIIVGHSMGAQVTLLAHIAHPDAVSSEVVIDPAYGAAPESASGMAEWAARIRQYGMDEVSDFFGAATRSMDSALADRVLSDLHATSPEAIARFLLSEYVDDGAVGCSPATHAAAAMRRRPVLSLHSNQDSAGREASLESPAGSRSVTWRGHGHYLHLEDPDRFVRLLDEWRSEPVA